MTNSLDFIKLNTKESLNQGLNIDPKLKKSLDKQYRNRQELNVHDVLLSHKEDIYSAVSMLYELMNLETNEEETEFNQFEKIYLDELYQDVNERTKAAYFVAGAALTANKFNFSDEMLLSIEPNYGSYQLGIFHIPDHIPQYHKRYITELVESKSNEDKQIAKRFVDKEIKLDGAMDMAEHLYQQKIGHDPEYFSDYLTQSGCVANENFLYYETHIFENSSSLYDILYGDTNQKEKVHYFKQQMNELRQFLENNWKSVEKLAKALLKEKTLIDNEFLLALNA